MTEQDLHRMARALLEALARPGRPRPTPASDPGEAAAMLYEAVWRDGPREVAVVAAGELVAAVAGACTGTEEEPESGDTIVGLPGPARTRVAIDGPGCEHRFETVLPISSAVLAARAAACAAYPLGVELVLITEDATLIGLPRSTRITALG